MYIIVVICSTVAPLSRVLVQGVQQQDEVVKLEQGVEAEERDTEYAYVGVEDEGIGVSLQQVDPSSHLAIVQFKLALQVLVAGKRTVVLRVRLRFGRCVGVRGPHRRRVIPIPVS